MLEISIEYCAVWHYTSKAIRVMAELLEGMEDKIRSVSLVPSDGGRFEVTVNGRLVYSKLQTGRHPEEGELLKLVQRGDRGKG